MPDANTDKNDLISVRPEFLVYPDADETKRRRALLLEGHIDEAPDVYMTALKSMGQLATADSIEFDYREDNQSADLTETEFAIREYFTEQYDREVSYDELTEQALAENEEHRKLLKAHMEARSQYVRMGVMKSAKRANPEAETARNAMRYSRLAFFIGRVAAWSEQQKQSAPAPTNRLRSAG